MPHTSAHINLAPFFPRRVTIKGQKSIVRQITSKSTCSSVHKWSGSERDHLQQLHFHTRVTQLVLFTLKPMVSSLFVATSHSGRSLLIPFRSRLFATNACAPMRFYSASFYQQKQTQGKLNRTKCQRIRGAGSHKKNRFLPFWLRVICIYFVWDKSDSNPDSYLTSLVFTHTCCGKVNTPSESNTLMDDLCIKT